MVVRERDVVADVVLRRAARAVEAVRPVRVQEVPIDYEIVDVGKIVVDADGRCAAALGSESDTRHRSDTYFDSSASNRSTATARKRPHGEGLTELTRRKRVSAVASKSGVVIPTA